MKKPKTPPTIQQLRTTNKAYKLRDTVANDTELRKLLKLSKVTMYTRLRDQKWTVHETLWVEYLTNQKLKEIIDSLNILA